MNPQLLLAAILLVTLSRTGHAGLVGIVVEDITDNALGLTEYAIYAQFDSQFDTLLGVASPNIISTTSFYHSNLNGQVSALPWTSAQNAQTNTPDVDSFVTIGLFTGDGSKSIVFPGFDTVGFLSGNTIVGKGWTFTIENGFSQGMPDADGKVLIAVFTPTNTAAGKPGVIEGTVTLAYNSQSQLNFTEVFFTTAIPAPGVIALVPMLALAGSRGRRRTIG